MEWSFRDFFLEVVQPSGPDNPFLSLADWSEDPSSQCVSESCHFCPSSVSYTHSLAERARAGRVMCVSGVEAFRPFSGSLPESQ